MIKHIFSTILTLTFLSSSFAQSPVIPATNLALESETSEESLIIQHKDIEIVIGDLKIKAPFLYQGELMPKQGYIVSIRDTIRIKDIVEGCQSSCDVLTDSLLRSCTAKIDLCQKNCDDRIKKITHENDMLRLNVKNLKSDVSKEKTQKYIWAIASGLTGAGLGILVYEISK